MLVGRGRLSAGMALIFARARAYCRGANQFRFGVPGPALPPDRGECLIRPRCEAGSLRTRAQRGRRPVRRGASGKKQRRQCGLQSPLCVRSASGINAAADSASWSLGHHPAVLGIPRLGCSSGRTSPADSAPRGPLSQHHLDIARVGIQPPSARPPAGSRRIAAECGGGPRLTARDPSPRRIQSPQDPGGS